MAAVETIAGFSPIPRAVCTFTLDQQGLVGANTILGDLFADGLLDRPDLQPIAERVHAALRPERRQAIQDAFAALFPTGLGRRLQTVADDENSPTPGRFFLPIPAGAPGVIATAGGLVIGGGGDSALRAIDAATGAELWHSIPGRRINGTPMTYRTAGGRQFIVAATGGGQDAALVAFALP